MLKHALWEGSNDLAAIRRLDSFCHDVGCRDKFVDKVAKALEKTEKKLAKEEKKRQKTLAKEEKKQKKEQAKADRKRADRKFKRRSKGTREPRPEAIGPKLALLGHSAPTPTLRRSQRYRGRQFVGELRSAPRRARPFRSPAGHVMAAQRAERS